MKTPRTDHRRILRIGGVFASVVGASMLAWAAVAPNATSAFSTQLVAEPGQNPMPSAVAAVPENCKGIAPTPGSKNDVTQKQLNEGQGIVKVGPNSFDPGGTVHFLVLYNPTSKSASFDIRDCVVVFNPGNPHIAAVLALIDPAGHGQIIPTPGSTPAIKGFDAVVDNAEFDFPDNAVLPGEFDLSWSVPVSAPPGALICNYAKDTGGSHVGGKENRKAGGACFSVPVPPTTTTTSTSTTSTTKPPAPPPPITTSTTSTTSTSTTSTTSPTSTTSTSTTSTTSTSTTSTSTTSPGPAPTAGPNVETTTTIPTQVLGESFSKPPLAFTGENVNRLVAAAGAFVLAGGVLMLAGGRRRSAVRGR